LHWLLRFEDSTLKLKIETQPWTQWHCASMTTELIQRLARHSLQNTDVKYSLLDSIFNAKTISRPLLGQPRDSWGLYGEICARHSDTGRNFSLQQFRKLKET
jgi:hypothetical protein